MARFLTDFSMLAHMPANRYHVRMRQHTGALNKRGAVRVFSAPTQKALKEKNTIDAQLCPQRGDTVYAVDLHTEKVPGKGALRRHVQKWWKCTFHPVE